MNSMSGISWSGGGVEEPWRAQNIHLVYILHSVLGLINFHVGDNTANILCSILVDEDLRGASTGISPVHGIWSLFNQECVDLEVLYTRCVPWTYFVLVIAICA